MSVHKYSTAADSNTSVGDGGDAVSIAEGMPRGDVNNAMRSIASDIAKSRIDSGELTTAGAGLSLTLTTASDISALTSGLRLIFKAHLNILAGATLNVNGIGERPIKLNVDGALVAVRDGDFPQGSFLQVVYDGAEWVSVSSPSFSPSSIPAPTDIQAVAGNIEGVTAIADTVSIDDDGNLVVFKNGSYQYPKGQVLQSFTARDTANEAINSGATVTRHSVTITPKSTRSTLRFFGTVALHVAFGSPTNAPIFTSRLNVDGVTVDDVENEFEIDSTTVDEKSYSQVTHLGSVSSTGSAMIFVVEVSSTSSSRNGQIRGSSLLIEEISGGMV